MDGFQLLGLNWIEASLGLIILTNLCLMVVERPLLSIRFLAFQGFIMGIMPLMIFNKTPSLQIYAITAVFVSIKAFLMPWLLSRTCKKISIQKSKEPYLGNTACVALGLAGLAFSLWISEQLEISSNPLLKLFLPVAFSTIFSGLLIIVTRKIALAQVFGYLVTENGIFLLGVPMAHAASLWVELSILLDVLVGVFVMGIAIHHISKAFDSIDVELFASLKD